MKLVKLYSAGIGKCSKVILSTSLTRSVTARSVVRFRIIYLPAPGTCYKANVGANLAVCIKLKCHTGLPTICLATYLGNCSPYSLSANLLKSLNLQGEPLPPVMHPATCLHNCSNPSLSANAVERVNPKGKSTLPLLDITELGGQSKAHHSTNVAMSGSTSLRITLGAIYPASLTEFFKANLRPNLAASLESNKKAGLPTTYQATQLRNCSKANLKPDLLVSLKSNSEAILPNVYPVSLGSRVEINLATNYVVELSTGPRVKLQILPTLNLDNYSELKLSASCVASPGTIPGVSPTSKPHPANLSECLGVNLSPSLVVSLSSYFGVNLPTIYRLSPANSSRANLSVRIAVSHLITVRVAFSTIYLVADLVSYSEIDLNSNLVAGRSSSTKKVKPSTMYHKSSSRLINVSNSNKPCPRAGSKSGRSKPHREDRSGKPKQ